MDTVGNSLWKWLQGWWQKKKKKLSCQRECASSDTKNIAFNVSCQHWQGFNPLHLVSCKINQQYLCYSAGSLLQSFLVYRGSVKTRFHQATRSTKFDFDDTSVPSECETEGLLERRICGLWSSGIGHLVIWLISKERRKMYLK